MSNISKSIEQIYKLEKQARALRNKLDGVEDKWNALQVKVRNTPE